jgi:para-aminobenzoate synthetase/4-amino-4-deoxychorismate lyase
VTLPGGLGAHKWRDRQLLDVLTSDHAGAAPLLLDGDGSVLEAAWGNVFVLEGEVLLTPPADGRLLPGVTRAALLAAAAEEGLQPREEALSLARFTRADAILFSSSLAGAIPAAVGERGGASPGALALSNRLTRRLVREPAAAQV